MSDDNKLCTDCYKVGADPDSVFQDQVLIECRLDSKSLVCQDCARNATRRVGAGRANLQHPQFWELTRLLVRLRRSGARLQSIDDAEDIQRVIRPPDDCSLWEKMYFLRENALATDETILWAEVPILPPSLLRPHGIPPVAPSTGLPASNTPGGEGIERKRQWLRLIFGNSSGEVVADHGHNELTNSFLEEVLVAHYEYHTDPQKAGRR